MASLIACGKKNEKTFSEFNWPNSDVAKLFPALESTIGSIAWETSYGFATYVAETPKEKYSEDVDACKDNGFTVDYRAGDDFIIMIMQMDIVCL